MSRTSRRDHRSHLKENVLVLNKFWQPVGVSTVKKVVKKMFTTSCRIIDTYVDPELRAIEEAKPEDERQTLRGSYATLDLSQWLDRLPRAGEDVILAAKTDVICPEICTFESYMDMPKMIVRLNQHNLLERDHYRCQYCNVVVARRSNPDKIRKVNEFTRDHVTPVCMGGKSTWENLVTCCFKCNNKKAGRTPEQAHMALKKKPVEPRWTLNLIRNSQGKKKSWDDLLGHQKSTEEPELVAANKK